MYFSLGLLIGVIGTILQHVSAYQVITCDDDGQGSLREAINHINQDRRDNIVSFHPNGVDAQSINLGSPVQIDQPVTLNVESGEVILKGHGLTGSGGFTKGGPGTLIFTEKSTHQGPIVIKEGIIAVKDDSYLGEGTAPLLLDGGTIRYMDTTALFSIERPLVLGANGGTIYLKPERRGFPRVIIESQISGLGALVVSGEGSLTLSDHNTYSGGTFFKQGHLIITSDECLGEVTSPLIFERNRGDRILGFSGLWNRRGEVICPLHEDRALIFNGEGEFYISDDITIKSFITGSGTFIKSGSNKLTLGRENQISSSTQVEISDGILDFNNFPQHIGGLSSVYGGSRVRVLIGHTNLTISEHNRSEFTGSIQGTGGIIKNGEGWWILTGKNTYTGDTVINEGELILSGEERLNSKTLIKVEEMGTFKIKGEASRQTVRGLEGKGKVFIEGSTVIFDTPAAEAYDFKGRVRGEGALVKKGPGLQKMICFLKGNLEVEEGALIIAGSIGRDRSSHITIKQGGQLLMGSWIKGNVSVAGTFGSNFKESTLEVDGDVTFEPGATLQLASNAEEAFYLNILGTLTVPPEGINVRIRDLDADIDSEKKHTVLKAGDFNGVSVEKLHILQDDFDNVIYSFSLNQATHELYLHSHLKELASSPFLTQKGPSFKEGSSFENVKNYVTYIKETYKVHPDLNRLVTVLDSQSPDKQEAAYQKVTPAINSTLRQVTAQIAQLASNQILAHQRYNNFFGSNGIGGSTQRFRAQSALGDAKHNDHRLMIERLGGFDGTQAYQLSEGTTKTIVESMGLPAQEMPKGEDQKSGGLKRFLTLLGQMKPYYQDQEGTSLWIQPMFQTQKKDLNNRVSRPLDDGEVVHLDDGTIGVIGGADYWIKPNVLIGLSLSGAWNELEWWNKKRTSTGSSCNNMMSGSVYGTFLIKDFSLEGNVSITRTVYKSSRSYEIEDVGEFRANQTHKSISGGIDLKGGYGLNYGHHFIEPYVRLGYRCEAEPAYKETGNNGLTFAVKDHTAHRTRFEAGIWGIHNTHPLGWDIAPSYQISFVHKNPGKRGNGLSAGLVHYAGGFETQGWAGDRNFLNAGIGFVLGLEEDLGCSFNYHAELSSHGKTHNFLMTMRVRI